MSPQTDNETESLTATLFTMLISVKQVTLVKLLIAD